MNGLLLDTHAFLFAIENPTRLSPKVRRLLQDPDVDRFVSVVSLWEIAIKIQVGRLDLPLKRAYYLEHLERAGASLLAIQPAHSFEIFELPLHHKDPFDRLLIAQARVEKLTLVTKDEELAVYEVDRLW